MADQPGQQAPSSSAQYGQEQEQRQQQQYQPYGNVQEQVPAPRPGYYPYSPHQPPYLSGPQQPFQQQMPTTYDMTAMAQSLPNLDYRQQQYGPGAQGFPVGTPPVGTGQVPLQLFVPVSGPSPIQTYYLPQQPPPPIAAPLYQGNFGDGLHPHVTASLRRGQGYYTNHVPPQAPFYYPQQPPFPHQSPAVHRPDIHRNHPSGTFARRSGSQAQITNPGEHYQGAFQQGALDGQGAWGTRKDVTQMPRNMRGWMSSTFQGAGADPAKGYMGQEQARTTSIIRGPPRKPKRSGEYALYSSAQELRSSDVGTWVVIPDANT